MRPSLPSLFILRLAASARLPPPLLPATHTSLRSTRSWSAAALTHAMHEQTSFCGGTGATEWMDGWMDAWMDGWMGGWRVRSGWDGVRREDKDTTREESTERDKGARTHETSRERRHLRICALRHPRQLGVAEVDGRDAHALASAFCLFVGGFGVSVLCRTPTTTTTKQRLARSCCKTAGRCGQRQS